MKRLEKFLSVALLLAVGLFFTNVSHAQCGKFTESSDSEAAETAHVLYRDNVKQKQFDAAYEDWKKVFELAPAADGARDVHYTDGVKILKHKLKASTDEAEQAALKEQIVALYDGAVACLESGAIKLGKIKTEDRIAFHLGRKAFDQFYDLRTPYVDNIKTLATAVEKGGLNTEYTVLYPYAFIAVRQFIDEQLSKEEARAIHAELGRIVDHNIANNEKYKDYFVQTKASIEGEFAQIERNIFDCEYFVEKVRPAYEANPDDKEVLRETITTLKKQGCQAGVPLLDEVEKKWAKYAAAENAARKKEFEANNPAMMAKKAYDAGDFNGAIAKYEEALATTTDQAKKGSILFSIASIQGRKLKQYSKARSTALKAAAANPSSGRPYMLIGDLYAKASRTCGNDGYSRGLAVLAAIAKYRKGKSVDPSVSEEANKKIGTYKKSIPTKEDVFMRSMQGGKTAKVGCWIGEQVKVEYQQ